MAKNIVELIIQAEDKASGEIRGVGEELAGLEKISLATTGALVAGAGATAAALVKMTRDATRYADEIDNLSQRTLLSQETLATLGLALTRVGEDFFASEMAARTFQRAMVDAASGLQEPKRAFERLGMEADDLVNADGSLKTMEELLPSIADRFAGITDNASKVSIAMTLFGRSGTAMISFLSKGREGLEEFAAEAKRMGLVLDTETNDTLNEMDDRLNELNLSLRGFKNAIGSALAPAMTPMVEALKEGAIEASEFSRQNQWVAQSLALSSAAIIGTGGFLGAIVAGQKAMVVAQRYNLQFVASLRGFAYAGAAASMVGSLAFAVAGTVAAVADSVRVTRDAAAAEKAYRDELANTKGTVDDLVKKQQALEKARRSEALRALQFASATTRDISPARMTQMVHLVVEPDIQVPSASVDLAVKQAGEYMKAALRATPVAPTILMPVNIGDTRDEIRQLEADIKRFQDEAAKATAKRALWEEQASRGSVAKSDVEIAQKAEQDAINRVVDAQVKLMAARKKLGEEDRKAAEGVREINKALLEMEAASGRITLDDLFKAQSAEVERLRAEVKDYRTKLKGLDEGTFEYKETVEDLRQSVSALQSSEQEAEQTRQMMQSQYRSSVESANALSDSLRDLGRAEAQAAIIEADLTDEQEQQAISQLRLKNATTDLAAAYRAWDAGPLPEKDHADAIRELESAERELAGARDEATKIAAKLDTGDQLRDIGVGAGRSFVGGVIDGFAGGELRLKETVIRIVATAIEQLIVLDLAAASASKASTAAATAGVAAASTAGAAAAGAATAAGAAAAAAASATIAAAAAQKAQASIGVGALGLGPLGGLGMFLSLIPMQTGGKIVSGRRGHDSELLAVGRGEAVIDHSITTNLERFLADQGQQGRPWRETPRQPLMVSVNPGMMTGSTFEARRMARTVRRELTDYERRSIASARY